MIWIFRCTKCQYYFLFIISRLSHTYFNRIISFRVIWRVNYSRQIAYLHTYLLILCVLHSCLLSTYQRQNLCFGYQVYWHWVLDKSHTVYHSSAEFGSSLSFHRTLVSITAFFPWLKSMIEIAELGVKAISMGANFDWFSVRIDELKIRHIHLSSRDLLSTLFQSRIYPFQDMI